MMANAAVCMDVTLMRERLGRGICRRVHLITKADHIWLIQRLQNHAIGPNLEEGPTQEGQISHEVSVHIGIGERNESKAALQTDIDHPRGSRHADIYMMCALTRPHTTQKPYP